MELRIAGIEQESVVDGPGIRYVIFTQGCPHHCPGCHNPHTHAREGGQIIKLSDLLRDIPQGRLHQGVTFSGGEPFLQAEALVTLGKEIKERGLDLLVYTGYVYEDLLRMAVNRPSYMELLKITDWLIDGPFIQHLRAHQLPYRGSTNQRLIPTGKILGRQNYPIDQALSV